MFLTQHLSMLSFAVTQKTSQPLQYLGAFGVVQLRGCPQKCCLLRVLEAQKVCQKTYPNPVKLREAFREAFTLTLGLRWPQAHKCLMSKNICFAFSCHMKHILFCASQHLEKQGLPISSLSHRGMIFPGPGKACVNLG